MERKLNRYALIALIAFLLQFVVPLFKSLLRSFPPFNLIVYTDFGSPILLIIAITSSILALRKIKTTQEKGKILSWIILLLSLIQVGIFLMMIWVVSQL